MEAIERDILNQSGVPVEKTKLRSDIYDVAIDPGLLHQVVVWQLAKRRAGTHSTLTKGEIVGGSKKPWRQKGTGRARAGDYNSPHWVGGAVAHGPKPRSYETRLGKKVRRQALAGSVSAKVREGALVIVDSLNLPELKTRAAAELIRRLGVAEKKIVILFAEEEQASARCFRNITGVTCLPVSGLNVFDVVKASALVASAAAIAELEKRFV